jgi:hypothetical protein
MLSAEAFELEKAGASKDAAYISSKGGGFMKKLKAVTARLTPETPAVEDGGAEDSSYLREQLKIIKAAAEDYDEATAFEVLERLKEKAWRKETYARLEQIHDDLFLRSDFEGAAQKAGEFLSERSA